MRDWKVFSLTTEDGIAVVVFDVPGSPINTWNISRQLEWEAVTDELLSLERSGAIKAVVMVSGKPGNFIAGTDLENNDAGEMTREKLVESLIDSHRSMGSIGKLSVPSVVGIDGYAMGGGLEFALSFTARVAKDGPRTGFGCPEINLGIFPGGGGTQRLPRLIGPAAVDVIMNCETLLAEQALKIGIIDRLIPPDTDLVEACKEMAMELVEGKTTLLRKTYPAVDIVVACEVAEADIKAKRHGYLMTNQAHALQVIKEGCYLPLQDGIRIEAEHFADNNTSAEASGCMHAYSLRRLRKKIAGEEGTAIAETLKSALTGPVPDIGEFVTEDFLTPLVAKAADLVSTGINPMLIDAVSLFILGFPQELGGVLKAADLKGISEKMYAKKFY